MASVLDRERNMHQEKSVQRTEVQFSMSRGQSGGGRSRDRQVVAGEVIESHTLKDLREQCWDFIIKKKAMGRLEVFSAEEKGECKELVTGRQARKQLFRGFGESGNFRLILP